MNGELPSSAAGADVRHTEEVEGARFLPLPLRAFLRVTPKFQQPCLLLTPAKNSLYRVSAYGVVTVPNGNTGFWHLKLNWTDDYGAENCYNGTSGGVTCSLLAINSNWENYGEYRWAHQPAWIVRAVAGAPISYAVTDVGGATGSTYDLFLTVEQLE